MRGVPESNREQQIDPSPLPVAVPTLVPKEPIPPALAELGREVLALVPRKPQPSLAAYRQAAEDLSRVLRVTGTRI